MKLENIDPMLLAKLKTLDDSSLSALIGELADAAGADEKQKARALDNVALIKRKLANADNNELNRAARKLLANTGIGEDELRDIADKLGGARK